MKASRETSRPSRYLFLFMIPIVLGIFVLSSAASTSSKGVQEYMGDQLTYKSLVCADVVRADGTKFNAGCDHNFFTPNGRNMVMDALGFGGGGNANTAYDNNVTQIALCNISNGPVGTYSCYNSGGLANVSGTFTKVNDPGNWSISATFTSTTDGQTVNGTEILNGSTTGAIVFANNTFNAVTLNNLDTITIRWNMSIS